MKKLALITGMALGFLNANAHAASVTCEETAASIKNNGSYADTSVTLEFASDDSAEITLKFYDGKTKKTSKSTAQIDSKFKSNGSSRYIADDNFGGSDSGETAIFVSNKILEGKNGTMSFSSNQANDGDSGPKFLWGTDATFECK